MQTLEGTYPRNPFPIYGGRTGQDILGWRYVGPDEETSKKVYPSQLDALKALVDHLSSLEKGRKTLHQRVLDFIKDGSSKLLGE